MRYLIEPRERRYIKAYGFLSFAKNIGKNISNKYGQKLVDTATKSVTDAMKNASKRAIQKTVEATEDLVGNKIADNITSTSKKSLKKPRDEELSSTELHSNEINKEIPKERNIFRKERQQIIDELRLI